ncbi:MAG TPA: UbiA family prenyltransferase [Pyrinomonadaceae bacterium]|nr:UbiA family prenyltransferase [Pyrinomonadaceae bacterium]
MLRYLVYMLRIRRVEFRIAEIPILAIPLLILLRDTAPLKTFQLWEGIFIFFLLFAFGDMINCLADRDLDAVYKPHLSEAVYGLGVRFVTFQVIATALLALILSFHLSWVMNRWLLFVLVAIGLLLGAAYSVKPVQLKGRGLAQLICLWLIIFVGPMLFVGLLVDAVPSLSVLIFAAAYGTLQMGIILVNTAEDYPEDLSANITTSIVALGLHRGIGLAFWLVVIGAIGVLTSLIWMLWQRASELIWILATLPAIAACIYVIASVGGLRSLISGASLEDSIRTVKHAAKRVPLWVTIVAWSLLGASYALFYAGHK